MYEVSSIAAYWIIDFSIFGFGDKNNFDSLVKLFVLVIAVKLGSTCSLIHRPLNDLLFISLISSVDKSPVKLSCATELPHSYSSIFCRWKNLSKSIRESEHTYWWFANDASVVLAWLYPEKHLDYDNAWGEAHGKEERMDEVFIDDSQGHGDDQLVYEYACRITSPTRN